MQTDFSRRHYYDVDAAVDVGDGHGQDFFFSYSVDSRRLLASQHNMISDSKAVWHWLRTDATIIARQKIKQPKTENTCFTAASCS